MKIVFRVNLIVININLISESSLNNKILILHQKLKKMEFRGKNLIYDFLLNFTNLKIIYFDL